MGKSNIVNRVSTPEVQASHESQVSFPCKIIFILKCHAKRKGINFTKARTLWTQRNTVERVNRQFMIGRMCVYLSLSLASCMGRFEIFHAVCQEWWLYNSIEFSYYCIRNAQLMSQQLLDGVRIPGHLNVAFAENHSMHMWDACLQSSCVSMKRHAAVCIRVTFLHPNI